MRDPADASVNPCFGGQSFIPQTLINCAKCVAALDASGYALSARADGGVKVNNIGEIAAAGADMFAAARVLAQPHRECPHPYRRERPPSRGAVHPRHPTQTASHAAARGNMPLCFRIVADTPGALHASGLSLGSVTNKPTPFVAPLLESLDIAKYSLVWLSAAHDAQK